MLLHADGFAFFGTGATSRTNMAQGLYATAATGVSCETTNPRPGGGTHHLRVASSATDTSMLRLLLGSTITGQVGVGFALYLSALPAGDVNVQPVNFRDAANAGQCNIVITNTGRIRLRRSTTTVQDTADGVIVAGAYQHVEIMLNADNAGACEIRVNGVTVMDVSGVDLQAQASPGIAQLRFGTPDPTETVGVTMDIADLHVFDTSGSVNNDFFGDCVWLPRYPNGDLAASDWTRNTGSDDYAAIDDTTPDSDTTYIEAASASPAAESEFSIANLPANAAEVIGVVSLAMLRKTDAGAGSAQVSIVSGTSPFDADDGADNPLTTTYTYYKDVFEVDPATGVRWTPAGFNAASLRLTRTL